MLHNVYSACAAGYSLKALDRLGTQKHVYAYFHYTCTLFVCIDLISTPDGMCRTFVFFSCSLVFAHLWHAPSPCVRLTTRDGHRIEKKPVDRRFWKSIRRV